MSRPSIEVRRACVDDLDDLLLLWSQSREELSRSLRSPGALPVEQLRPRLREALTTGEPTVLLGRCEGSPAGYAVLRLAPVLAVDGAALHIDHLYVAPSLRRRGVARGLLMVVTGIAERNGADQVLAGAPPSARDTHRFLARLGFSPLVVRRVVGTAALRRRLTGEGSRRGLEDLLSRRRSLRARAARSGWPGGGWTPGARTGPAERPGPVGGDLAVVVPDVDTSADVVRTGVRTGSRTGTIVIADCLTQHIDLGRLEADPLPGRPAVAGAYGPDDGRGEGAPDVPPADARSHGAAADESSPAVEPVPGQSRRRQRA